MAQATIKVEKQIWDRVKRCSKSAGYSSPEEFVEHVLERELAKHEDQESDADIVRKLKGLGYLD